MRRVTNVVLVLLASSLTAALVTACAQPTPAPAPTQALAKLTEAPTPMATQIVAPTEALPTAAPKPRVAMIFSGLINDGGWNTAGYNSLMEAEKELGIDVAYVESVSVPDCEAVLRDYADQKYDLIVAHGSQYQDVALKVAQDYPNVAFAVSQGQKRAANVASYSSSVHESAYVIGMLGGYMSKTGKLGFMSGMKMPSQLAALNAYREGAKAANPNAEVIATFVGLESWSDTVKGREAALAQIEAGADVIMPRGDGMSLGAIQACKERKVFAIGNASDQWDVAPGVILTSNIYDYTPYIKLMLDDIKAGKFGNKDYMMGMKDGATGLSDYHGLVPDDVAQKIQDVINKIKSGELVVKEDVTDY